MMQTESFHEAVIIRTNPTPRVFAHMSLGAPQQKRPKRKGARASLQGLHVPPKARFSRPPEPPRPLARRQAVECCPSPCRATSAGQPQALPCPIPTDSRYGALRENQGRTITSGAWLCPSSLGSKPAHAPQSHPSSQLRDLRATPWLVYDKHPTSHRNC